MNNFTPGVYNSMSNPYLPYRPCLQDEDSNMNYSFDANSRRFTPNVGPYMKNSLVDMVGYYPPIIPYTQSLGDAERKMVEMSYAQGQNWDSCNNYNLDHHPEYDFSYTSIKSKVMFYDSLWNVSSQEDTIRYWMQNYPNCIVEIVKIADNNLKKVIVKDIFEDNTPEYSLALSTIGILTNTLSIAEGLKFMMRILHIYEFYDLLVWSLLYLDAPAAMDLKKEILKCVYYATFCPKAVCRFRHNENLYKALRLCLKQTNNRDTIEKALLITQNLLYNITESKCSNYVIDRLPVIELKQVTHSSQSDLRQLSDFILKKIDKLRHFYQKQFNEKPKRRKVSQPKRFISTLDFKPRSFEKEVKAVEELFIATFPEKDPKKKRPLTAPEKISLEKIVADRSVSCIYFNEKVSEKMIKEVSESKNVSTQVDLFEDNISVIDSLVNLNSELIEEIVSFRNEVKSIYGDIYFEDYEKAPETSKVHNNENDITSEANSIDFKGYFVENEQIQLCHKKINIKEENRGEDSQTFEKIVMMRESPHSSYIIIEELGPKDSNSNSANTDEDNKSKSDLPSEETRPTINISYYELKKEIYGTSTIREIKSGEQTNNCEDPKKGDDGVSTKSQTKVDDSDISISDKEIFQNKKSTNVSANVSSKNISESDHGNAINISGKSSIADSTRLEDEPDVVINIVITGTNAESKKFEETDASGDAETTENYTQGVGDIVIGVVEVENDNTIETSDDDYFNNYITQVKQKFFDAAIKERALDEPKSLNDSANDSKIGDSISETAISEEKPKKKLHSSNATGDSRSQKSVDLKDDFKQEENVVLEEIPKMFDDVSFAEFISEVKKKFFDFGAFNKTVIEETANSEDEDTFVDDTKFKIPPMDKDTLSKIPVTCLEPKEIVDSKSDEITEIEVKSNEDTESTKEDKTISENRDERQIFDESSYTDLLKKGTFTKTEHNLDIQPLICNSPESELIHLKITATQDESTSIEKVVSATTLNLILDIINKEHAYSANDPERNEQVLGDSKNPRTLFFNQLGDEDDNIKNPTFLSDSEVNLLRNESLTKCPSRNIYNSSSECNLVEKQSQNQDISVVRLTNLSRKLVEEILTLKCQLETSNSAIKDLESKLQDQVNYESSVTAAYTKYTVSNNTVGEVASDMLAEEDIKLKTTSATRSLTKLLSSKTIICEKMTQKNFFGTKKLFTAVNKTIKKIFNILNAPVLDGMFDKMYQDIADMIPQRKFASDVEKFRKKKIETKITKRKDQLLKKYVKLVKKKILNIVYVNSVLIHMYVVTDRNSLPTFRNLQNYSKYTILNRHFYWDKKSRSKNKKENGANTQKRFPIFDFPKKPFACEPIPSNFKVNDLKQLKKNDVIKKALFYF